MSPRFDSMMAVTIWMRAQKAAHYNNLGPAIQSRLLQPARRWQRHLNPCEIRSILLHRHPFEYESWDERVTLMTEKRIQPQSDLPAGLAKPAQRALANAGCSQLKDLAKLSEDEVKKLHGMGPKALKPDPRGTPRERPFVRFTQEARSALTSAATEVPSGYCVPPISPSICFGAGPAR